MTTKISMLAIDLAKCSFLVCAVGPYGTVLYNRALSRGRLATLLAEQPACIVAMEACATSHHWGRVAQRHGHEVRLVPPAYVKPYVKRQKNDAADAEAICEAVTRPNMRFVPVKSVEQQAVLVLHRARDLLMRQRTMILNAIRAQIAEFGTITAQGPRKVVDLIGHLEDLDDIELPSFARSALLSLAVQLE